MSSTERPAKRARLEADKRRAALAKVQDKYADIDFTRFQKVVDADATGEATPHRFVLVRPVETALVKDWRQLSSYEPAGGAGARGPHGVPWPRAFQDNCTGAATRGGGSYPLGAAQLFL